MPVRPDEVMVVNGRLTQIGFSFRGNKKGTRRAVFRCECGNTTVVYLHNGITKTQSCRCLSADLSRIRERKHGHTSGKKNGRRTRTRTYRVWSGIQERCLTPGSQGWENYGARGITVCDRWRCFENFLADMGEAPEGMSIDRKNNDGDYEKSNCKWSTRKEQARNTRRNHRLVFSGKEMCLSEWEEEMNLPPEILYKRLREGWSVEKALTTPVRKSKRRSS